MEYTKDELVLMKAKLRRLFELERKHNVMAFYSGFATLVGVSGAAVSLSMCLENNMSKENSLLVGTCCVVASVMTGLFYKYIKGEEVKIEDDILDKMGDVPEYIIDEVYEEVHRRR